jgi:hypothetical protein
MAASQHPLDDRQHSHAIRRRQGGRTNVYGSSFYPPETAINGQGPAHPCNDFDPADGDPGNCANCGQYDGEHSVKAMGSYATAYLDEMARGIPGSDASTGAY